MGSQYVLSPLRDRRLRSDQRGIRIGAAAAPAYFTETQYRATLSREFNQLEPENAMKFGTIHPGPMTYDLNPRRAGEFR